MNNRLHDGGIYLYTGIGRHNPVIASCVLIVIVLYMEVIFVKGRGYPFSASSVDDR